MLRSVNACITVQVPEDTPDDEAQRLAETAINAALDPVADIRIVEYERRQLVTPIER